MSFPLSSFRGLIVVDVGVSGPLGQTVIPMILDTGATITIVAPSVLINVGYDPDAATVQSSVIMGNGQTTAPRLIVTRLSALGQHRFGAVVLAHARHRALAWTGSSASTSFAASASPSTSASASSP